MEIFLCPIFCTGSSLSSQGSLSLTIFPSRSFHDPGGIFLSQLWVVRDHDDQFILCDLLEQLHDLYAGFTVQRTGRLVCQQNIRIVDKRTGDGNALYLPAGHLIGLFMHVVAKTNLFQHGNRPLPAFLLV